MAWSDKRILTTHVGSLARPKDLLHLAKEGPSQAYEARLRASIAETVAQQVEHRLDIVNDGEFSKGSFCGYINERLGGFEPNAERPPFRPMRDHICFPDYYKSLMTPDAAQKWQSVLSELYPPLLCTAPITYTGHDILKRDLDNLKSALKGRDIAGAFVPAISPENAVYNKKNAYYATEEEFEVALADALREEYKAIVDAGFDVQVDDPQLITYYNRNPDASVADVRKWAEGRVEVLNHALRGIPQERIRLHVCYSFDMAPRVGDMDLRDLLDIILKINFGGLSFEGANPRHEHEWTYWETTRLPEDKYLIPGTVSISSLVVEHPELVAQRIQRFAKLVGRERVVASIDCGFGTYAEENDIHPSIAWAKIDALAEGAKLASKALW